MATVQDLISSLDITDQQVKAICRFIFRKEDVTNLTIGESLVILVCDFLRSTGMVFEDYVGIGYKFCTELVAHGITLEQRLGEHKAGKTETRMPWCFFTMLDNRYVGLSRSDAPGYPAALYDRKDDVNIPRLKVPPVFTLTVAVDALYMRTLAAKDGYEQAAAYFNQGLLVGMCNSERDS